MQEHGPGIVIVGAGQAGASAAAFLRQFGYPGAITLLGEEALAPYQRPPLSKAWLKREADAASLLLRAPEFWAAQHIALMTSTRVLGIDRAAQRVLLTGGETVAYDRLILALGAGSRILPLPGHDLPGVLTLRDTPDADALQTAMQHGSRVAIVGGGYIGLEVAASARALGAIPFVLEREPRVLSRVASAEFAHFLEAQHRAHGVEIDCGTDVEALEGAGRVHAVRLRDGRALPCDAALIAAGAIPRDDLARAAGLTCEAGIVVDLAARTSDPRIHAIGDCTLRPVPRYGRSLRVESVPSAVEQARQAASDICGRPPPPPEVPWFWSDQFELRIQLAGFLFDVARTVRRQGATADSFALFHLAADGSVQAVEAVNAATDFMAGKRLIARAAPVPEAALADPTQSLRAIAA